MSAVEELTIALEHDIDEQYQYQPGEVIGGNVRIKVSNSLIFVSICIVFRIIIFELFRCWSFA
jgi:hypothetical protein